MPRRRAIFLDRDGVLTKCSVDTSGTPHPPRTIHEMEILSGVHDGCVQLKRAGFLLICVTNQPDVARGTQTRAVVDAMNARLQRALSLDAVYTCYHDTQDGCDCRKPLPGMIIQGAHDFGIDLPGSFMVGDRWRDVEAGRRAGCQTVFVDYHYSESYQSAPADIIVASPADAVRAILKKSSDGPAKYPQVD